ncbi:hypothetical protein OIU84_003290 [Salix udensis]|uniref:Uncharacterized protein n=1 Tax=Salix udensis TaxID=889485 RepID=A0AAD6K5V8_9ROSI|nr:hypothetical protein OIU84_003290 [Salix udensis]
MAATITSHFKPFMHLLRISSLNINSSENNTATQISDDLHHDEFDACRHKRMHLQCAPPGPSGGRLAPPNYPGGGCMKAAVVHHRPVLHAPTGGQGGPVTSWHGYSIFFVDHH